MNRCFAEDSLLWLSTCCKLFEPRPTPRTFDFIPWVHQIPVWKSMEKWLGYRDIGLEKSRAEGASWLILMLCLHKWLYMPLFAAGFVSKDEKSADDPKNPDSLFWKIQFQLDNLPDWMVPKYQRVINTHSFTNLDNGATLVAYSATSDVASGGRKAQPLSSKIATPAGWVKMGSLSVGDPVIGSDGKPTTVTGVFPQGVKQVFRVVFSDGSSTRCCDDHLWKVESGYSASRNRRIEVKPLSEIRKDYSDSATGKTRNRYSIPVVDPVQFDGCQLPVDPYLLGVLLGDGHFGSKHQVNFATADDEIVRYVAEAAPDGLSIRKDEGYSYAISARRRGANVNCLSKAIRDLGLARTRSHNKFIPDIYMRSSVWDRLQLLRGLMDTDGSVVIRERKSVSCEVSYASTGEQLARDVQQLVWSLGGVASMKKYARKQPDNDIFVLRIRMPNGMCPFRLTRKAERYIEPSRYPVSRKIVSIEPDGYEECQCIMVSAEDHLYVTDDYVVTHNTVFVMDELAKFPRGPDKEAMASTQYVTECRYLISTPKGPDGAYFDAMHGTSNMLKLQLAWEDNPSRTIGSYRVHIAQDNTRSLELVDLGFWMQEAERNGSTFQSTGEMLRAADAIRADDGGKNPFSYPFVMTGPYVKSGCLRSPWYDYQCNRPGATPQSISQELDRDYGGSTSRFFDNNMLQRVKKRCSTPVTVGELTIPKVIEAHSELINCRFREIYGARLKLWFKPSIYGTVPPGRRYVIGGDIASGSGGAETHNSCLEVIDVLVGRQVAEIAGNTITPFELAEYAVALAYWFSYEGIPAKLIWEQNGLGGQFALRITQLGFSNVYYRGRPEEYDEIETKKVGFWTTAKTKPALLGELGRAIDSGQLEVNSYQVIEEMAYYTNLPGGKIEHLAAINEEDPSGAGDRHGDRVVALALAWWEAKEYVQDVGNASALQAIVPANSVLGRRQQARGEAQQRELWVPSSLRRRQSVRSK